MVGNRALARHVTVQRKTEAQRSRRPSRSRGSLELDDVGHWIQHEAAAKVSDQLVKFLHTLNPA